MKKLLIMTLTLAGTVLVSCTQSEYIGESMEIGKSNAIVFNGEARKLTRADLYGAAAADKLSNKFVVYGTKHTAAEDATSANDDVVFSNFQVEWAASTAGTTESNSSDWEYVGKQAYNAAVSSQGIKYWDYSAEQGYTFYAFSSSDISYPANASDKVVVNKVTSDALSGTPSLYNKGYEVIVKDGADLSKLYFADRVPVAKANYGNTVCFTFRNVGTKVRVGFYETIPGYNVTIDKFYIDDAATAAVTDFAAMNDAQTDGFYASLQNVKNASSTDAQILNVTYYDNTDATVENQPKATNPSLGYDYSLKLGAGVIGTTLSDNATAPTWDKTSGAYTNVFPFEDNTNPLLIKLDFTLTADDGSGDEIKVRGARAIVPAEYVKWKSNFAYTYIFKISDKSNGTTGNVDGNGDPTDPEGLKPITFDAIVVDVAEETQQTITTVSTNSITTYAEGAITNEYTNGNPIYVTVTDNSTHAVITPTAIGAAAGNAKVYQLNKAATEAAVLGQLTGSPMGITFTDVTATIETTIPLADGTTPALSNVKFTPSAAGTYAFVYTTTAYAAPTYAVQTTGTYDSSKTYYMLSGSGAYYAVSVPNAEAFNANKADLYLQTDPGTPGVYDVKVIKVQ